MKLSTTLASSALLALSLAMPLEKRQDVTITTTVDVIETVDVVVTVWLPPGGQPVEKEQLQQVAQPNRPNLAPIVHITPVRDAVVPNHTPPPAPPASPAPPAAQPDSQEASQSDANKVQEQSNSAQAAKNLAAQEQSIKAQDQVNKAQEKANNNKIAENQAASKQAAPAPIAQAPPAPVNTPAAAPVDLPSTPPATFDTTSLSQTQSTSGGSCGEIGGSCSAPNVTFFEGGLGACGWSNDTASEDFFALAHDMMGLQSNGNPFCGRKAAITHDGNTIVGTLTDKCMGCGLQSIDLSQHLYDQMFKKDVGNYHNIEWHFIS